MSAAERTGSTVAAGDIARLAGVGRAAVSNWRRRFPDFPEPVGGTASSPLYLLDDVESWLAAHGRGIRVSPEDRVWQWLRTEVDDLQLGDVMGHLGAFAVFLRREPETWSALADAPDEQLASTIGAAVAAAVSELPGGFPERPDPELVAVLRTVADVAGRRGAARTFGFLVGRYLDAHARRLPVTPTPTAELLVRLAQVRGTSVLDPACGTGALLVAAESAGARAVAGQEVNPGCLRLAGARLLIHRPGAELATGDALREDAFARRRFGAVVCNPPWGDRNWGYDELAGDPRWEFGLPPRGEPELAWLQHCLAHLEPGGMAAVVIPVAVAGRRSGRRIRGNLLRAGAVRALISLPADGGLSCDVWVLHRPHPGEAPPAHVLLVVAPDLTTMSPLWEAFCTDPARGDTEHSRAVRIIDLLDDEVDLCPARHVPPPAAAGGADYDQARRELQAALDGLSVRLPALAALAEPRELPLTTVGELAKAGVVTLAQAPVKMALGDGPVPVLTAKDVVERRGPTGRTAEQPGLVGLEPGDVVAAAILGRDAAVRVVTEPGAVLGPRLMSFRADPDRLDPHFLAGFLRVAGVSAGTTRSATGPSRTDARRVPIPLLPLDEQRAYGAAFRGLATFLDALRDGAAAGEALVRLGLEGLADGRLVARG